jgi:hypothetical protein
MSYGREGFFCMEEEIDLDSFSENIESLKEVSIRSKDYIKFVIGLSTGTLILSTTLAKDFFKTPQYNFILIIGWSLLFISIVIGVWILPAVDNIQAWFDWMKRKLANPEESHLLFSKKSGGHTLMGWMKELTHPYIREKEEIQKIFKSWENYLDKRDPKRKDLKKLKNLAETLGPMGVKEEAKQMVKDGVTEMFKLYPLLKSYEKQAYLPSFLKKIRWIIWQLKYLEKVMRYSFFVGMLAILVFTIINFIK